MEGSISIIISGNSLDFISIKENINVTPFKVVTKGDVVIRNYTANEDRWIYTLKFDYLNFSNKVDEILLNIYPYRDYIKTISTTNIVEFNCYIVTEMEQFGFSFSSTQIEKIKELGMSVNFDIISFGEDT